MHILIVEWKSLAERKEQKKWAKELSVNCGVSPSVLEFALEELSESCYPDSATSKKVVEELTISCHLNEEELKKFIADVAKNCPMDVKKLHEKIVQAEGDKDLAFKAIDKTIRRPM